MGLAPEPEDSTPGVSAVQIAQRLVHATNHVGAFERFARDRAHTIEVFARDRAKAGDDRLLLVQAISHPGRRRDTQKFDWHHDFTVPCRPLSADDLAHLAYYSAGQVSRKSPQNESSSKASENPGPPSCRGVLLDLLGDRFKGVQKARVRLK